MSESKKLGSCIQWCPIDGRRAWAVDGKAQRAFQHLVSDESDEAIAFVVQIDGTQFEALNHFFFLKRKKVLSGDLEPYPAASRRRVASSRVRVELRHPSKWGGLTTLEVLPSAIRNLVVPLGCNVGLPAFGPFCATLL